MRSIQTTKQLGDALRAARKQLGLTQPQLALAAGVGVRLDITFFVFRLDVAFPLRDPRYPSAIPQTYKPQPVLSVDY